MKTILKNSRNKNRIFVMRTLATGHYSRLLCECVVMWLLFLSLENSRLYWWRWRLHNCSHGIHGWLHHMRWIWQRGQINIVGLRIRNAQQIMRRLFCGRCFFHNCTKPIDSHHFIVVEVNHSTLKIFFGNLELRLNEMWWWWAWRRWRDWLVEHLSFFVEHLKHKKPVD